MSDPSTPNDELFGYHDPNKDRLIGRLDALENQIKKLQLGALLALFFGVGLAGGLIGYVRSVQYSPTAPNRDDPKPETNISTLKQDSDRLVPYQAKSDRVSTGPMQSPIVALAANPNVRLIDHLLERNGLWLICKGRAKNFGPERDFMKLKLTFEDVGGRFVDVEETYLEPSSLSTGEIGTFRTMIAPDPRFHRYIIQYGTEVLAEGVLNQR